LGFKHIILGVIVTDVTTFVKQSTLKRQAPEL